jgi:hypothetical protein
LVLLRGAGTGRGVRPDAADPPGDDPLRAGLKGSIKTSLNGLLPVELQPARPRASIKGPTRPRSLAGSVHGIMHNVPPDRA